MPSLTWHIVKKDFRYLWPWLSIWWGLLVASALDVVLSINVIFHSASEKSQQQVAGGFVMAYWFFLVVDGLMLAMVVDGILKGDSPIDEKAFWRTRPVDKGRMFFAKLNSICLFCFAVPGAIQAATHLIFGFSVSEYLHWLGQFLFIQGSLVALIALTAVLFQSTLKGLLTWAALIVGGFFVIQAFEIVNGGFGNSSLMLFFFGGAVQGWRYYPSLLFVTVFVVTTVIYLGKGRRIGVVALIGGLLINATAGRYFAGNQELRPGYDDWRTYQTAALNSTVKLSVVPSAFTDHPQYRQEWRIYGSINNPSFPELKNAVWRIRNSQSELTWPGAKSRVSKSTIQGAGMSSPQVVRPQTWLESAASVVTFPNYEVWGQQPAQLINAPVAFAAAGYGRLAWDTVGTWRNFPLALMNDQQLERIKTQPAKLTAKVYIESGHLEKIAEVPATEGSTWHDGMVKLQVHSSDRLDLTTFEIKLDSVSPWYLSNGPKEETIDRIFLLYNPQTQECVEGICGIDYPSYSPGFVWRQPFVRFSFPNETSPGDSASLNLPEKLHPPQSWLANARLVELAFVHEQYFYVPVALDSFVLPKAEPADAAKMQNPTTARPIPAL